MDCRFGIQTNRDSMTSGSEGLAFQKQARTIPKRRIRASDFLGSRDSGKRSESVQDFHDNRRDVIQGFRILTELDHLPIDGLNDLIGRKMAIFLNNSGNSAQS